MNVLLKAVGVGRHVVQCWIKQCPLNRTHFFHLEHWNVISPIIFPRQPRHLELSHTRISFFLFFFWCCQRASSNLVLTSMKFSVIQPPRWLHSVQARPLRLLCCFSCCLQGHLWCLPTVLGGFGKVSSSTAVSAQSAWLQFNSTVRSCSETTDSKIRRIQLTVANHTDCPQSVSGFHFLPFSCD